ncbi:corrinoid protein-associated methyltransferase CpaM [Candidatus Binatus soli]|uniref:corrinoid protein-associated methyltransferase CpaM n=1 Tax=Candidatus Binatus soli TaxID=1953413 RepID=UPI003D0D94EB
MSTYVLMRILESAPRRYDLGMWLLTFGSLGHAYDRLASRIHDGQRALDLGCGTGALTLRAAGRGAHVSAIDVNAQMLEIARESAQAAGLAEKIDFREMGIAELGGEASASYDVVMSGLCFSELSEDEIHYALKQIKRILRPGGPLLIADEVKPPDVLRRMLHALSRAPLVALAYVITQQTTHAVENLPEKVTHAGFSIESLRLNTLRSFVELVARAPGQAA